MIRDLINIGEKIAARLNKIGISTKVELHHTGAVEAHHQIKINDPDESLPVCYYLCSFEGALTDARWS